MISDRIRGEVSITVPSGAPTKDALGKKVQPTATLGPFRGQAYQVESAETGGPQPMLVDSWKLLVILPHELTLTADATVTAPEGVFTVEGRPKALRTFVPGGRVFRADLQLVEGT